MFVKIDNVANEFLLYQLHKEGADEANHAGPGVPDLCSVGEPQEGLAQLWLHPGHFNLNTTENEQLITVEKKLFFFLQLRAQAFLFRLCHSPLEEALQHALPEQRLLAMAGMEQVSCGRGVDEPRRMVRKDHTLLPLLGLFL